MPAEVRSVLEQLRRTIRDAVPGGDETISYGIPTITLNGRNLVSFAAWKRHVGLYPVPAVDDDLAQALKPYRAAKSTLRFPLGKPLPLELIAQLVGISVRQREDSGK